MNKYTIVGLEAREKRRPRMVAKSKLTSRAPGRGPRAVGPRPWAPGLWRQAPGWAPRAPGPELWDWGPGPWAPGLGPPEMYQYETCVPPLGTLFVRGYIYICIYIKREEYPFQGPRSPTQCVTVLKTRH